MRVAVLLLALVAPATVQADILHMRDGSRHYGTLISENEQQIVFRVTLADGTSGAVGTFLKTMVQRVERTAQDRPPGPRSTAAETPAHPPVEDFEQMLREAFELLDDKDLSAALRALQRTVSRASADVLPELEQQARSACGRNLDQLLAETRVRVALTEGRGRTFKLRYATRYESPVLGRLLEDLQAEFLAKRHRDRTITVWAATRDEYTELHAAAREMVTDARFAAAMIGARLKFDPRLRDDREERRRLIALRDELSRLAAHVMSLRGYTALSIDERDELNPAALEVARLRTLERIMQRSAVAASQPATSAKRAETTTPREEE